MRGRIGPLRSRTWPELVVFGDQRLHHVEHGLIDGGVDHLADAGALAVMQGGQRAHAGVHGRQRVADADADARGRAIGLADDVAQAAHGLADAAVAGALRVRTGLSVARHAHQDQPRIERGRAPPSRNSISRACRAESSR